MVHPLLLQLIMKLKMRHNLSNEYLIKLHSNNCVTSLYKFNMMLRKSDTVLHYHCNACYQSIAEDNFKPKKKLNTEITHAHTKTYVEVCTILYVVRLQPEQLVHFMMSYVSLSRLLSSELMGTTQHYEVIFNTDGIPVFKSSKYESWPLLLLINELPYKQR